MIDLPHVTHFSVNTSCPEWGHLQLDNTVSIHCHFIKKYVTCNRKSRVTETCLEYIYPSLTVAIFLNVYFSFYIFRQFIKMDIFKKMFDKNREAVLTELDVTSTFLRLLTENGLLDIKDCAQYQVCQQ